MEKRRVVITGMGAISSAGNTVEEMWENVKNGVSGIGELTRIDTSQYAVKVAAEIKDFQAEKYMDKKEARRMDLFVQYAVAAAKMAHEDSGLTITDSNADNIGVWIGSGIGGLNTFEEQHNVLLEKGPRRVSPFLVPMMIPDMATGMVSIALGAKGVNACTVTACASGTNSIGDAFKVIQRGDADAMFTGGTEAPISNIGVAGFASARALSTNPDPKTACRPFDNERNGFIMGEGAGIIVLEELEHALARGAKIYAEIIGYGATGDAYHMTAPAPNGEGGARAMKKALKDAGVEPTDVNYINAHGTSTELNDKFETAAIKEVFGEHAYNLMVSSTKSVTGHLLGAAGGVEAIFTALALQHDIVPPTINYTTPDPDCDLDYVPNKAREATVRVAASNSLGFGGHNATIVLKKYEG